MLGDLRLLFLLPAGVLAGNGDRDGISVREVAHLNGPVHQLVGGGVPVLSVVVIPLNQVPAVLVSAGQAHNPVVFTEGKGDVGVDLQTQGAIGGEVGLVVPKEHQTQTGGQGGEAG